MPDVQKLFDAARYETLRGERRSRYLDRIYKFVTTEKESDARQAAIKSFQVRLLIDIADTLFSARHKEDQVRAYDILEEVLPLHDEGVKALTPLALEKSGTQASERSADAGYALRAHGCGLLGLCATNQIETAREIMPHLMSGLKDPHWFVREWTLEALGKVQSAHPTLADQATLLDILEAVEHDPFVDIMALETLDDAILFNIDARIDSLEERDILALHSAMQHTSSQALSKIIKRTLTSIRGIRPTLVPKNFLKSPKV